MVYRTHIAFSTSLGLAPVCVAKFLGYDILEEVLVLYLSGLALGAVSPDIDEPNSYIGRKTGLISNIIKMIFGHRGATHYFIIPLLFLFCFAFLSVFLKFGLALNFFIIAFIIGYTGHILGDSMTKSGIRKAFFPFSKKTFYLLPRNFRFITGTNIETKILFPIFLAIVGLELNFIFPKFLS